MSQTVPTSPASRWPHRLAVLVVCATFPVIWVGGLVTTFDAGMAVPDWPTTYGYNLFLYPWQTWLFGPWDLFIEHGHRLLASLAGLFTILLVVSVWRCELRRWVRWLAVAALVGVIGQGLLGGLRVLSEKAARAAYAAKSDAAAVQNSSRDFARRIDPRAIARLHGCAGPAFFALAVSLAVCTSRRWREADGAKISKPFGQGAVGATRALFSTALVVAALTYLQLVLGAHVRHPSVNFTPGAFRGILLGHVIVGLLLAAYGVKLAIDASRSHVRPITGRLGLLLGALFAVQLGLGFATWVTNYGWPAMLAGHHFVESYVVVQKSLAQSYITTAHVATGSLLLGAAVALAMRTGRAAWLAHRTAETRRESKAADRPSLKIGSVMHARWAG